MTTLLEETRGYHEDIERLERAIVRDFKNEARTHKEKLHQSHRVKQMLQTVQDRSSRLVSRLPSRCRGAAKRYTI
jgi:splicing factor 3A subunit 3